MAVDSRRCPASQFFMEEEHSKSTYDKVVELLNEASLLTKDAQRIQNLKKVQELIVHKESNLLDNFLEEMLAFQNDKSVDVRKMVVGFIEEVCKKDADMLPKLIPSVLMLLNSDTIAVVKKVMLCMGQMYKLILQWLNSVKAVSEEMNQTWQYTTQIKSRIIEMIDSENDGLRTHSVKFLEAVVIGLTYRDAESNGNGKDFSLDKVAESHTILRLKKLEEEGKSAFEALVKFQGSPHISSVNLMTCMGAMTNIAKQRPQFMARVIQSFEALHVNLPPTLSKSQVSSVRKNLKMQMLALLRCPASVDFNHPITTLLTDLGATQMEVLKAMPKEDQSKKRKTEDAASSTKKMKVEPDATPARMEEEDDYGTSPFTTLGGPAKTKTKTSKTDTDQQSAIDITADDLIPRLTPPNVADLVLLSMVMLPDVMPAQFQSTYTPIAAAGTHAQIQHLARLLATQLTYAGLGKGIGVMAAKKKAADEQEEEEEDIEAGTSPKHVIRTLVGGSVDAEEEEEQKKPVALPIAPTTVSTSRKGMRVFKLASVTKPIDRFTADKMAMRAVQRILSCEKSANVGFAKEARMKILTSLVSQFGGDFKNELQNYIFADLRNRADLALAWIYQEYANFQGYNVATANSERPNIASYDECLTRLLTGLLERPDQREGLFSRLVLEAPAITENAIQVLRKYCQDETRIYLGMTTLKELILKRPCMKLEFLDVLLDFTSHEQVDVRNNAMRVSKTLHERPDLKDPIERYALYYLKYLMQPTPPHELFSSGKGRPENRGVWTEDTIRLCLYLYLGLMPINHKLIHELANVYTATTPDIKRTILRVLEAPVKGMGMDSPELLLLVENCPKGAETLITRVIHILTDKAAPSPDLVDRVRDLYHKRVSDVRFLIPVLNGLSKKQVVDALPKLIKLNPVVVKEVFNRLLGSHGENRTYTSPLTPAELLIALHYIEPQKCDMKTIIKATNLCFAEKTIYSQEVLAVVMQHLMEQSPLPTLLMRTVLQSLAMYPRLIGFVMNIMQRLIPKQVWKQKKVWEGFVRCCQRTRPQSFQVLLQLPSAQLKNAFEICADLREPLLRHVQSFTPHQRAHIPKAIMTILEKDVTEEEQQQVKAKKTEEERLAEQEKLYQQKLEEERKIQQEKIRQKQQDDLKDGEPSSESKQTAESENSQDGSIQTIGTVGTISTPGTIIKTELAETAEQLETNGTVSTTVEPTGMSSEQVEQDVKEVVKQEVGTDS